MKNFMLKLVATVMLLGAGFVATPQENANAEDVKTEEVQIQPMMIVDPGDTRP
jgi:hypothetical protein